MWETPVGPGDGTAALPSSCDARSSILIDRLMRPGSKAGNTFVDLLK